jgi:hypothetical protein
MLGTGGCLAAWRMSAHSALAQIKVGRLRCGDSEGARLYVGGVRMYAPACPLYVSPADDAQTQMLCCILGCMHARCMRAFLCLFVRLEPSPELA